MTVNVAIFNTKNNIVNAVNESGLPLSIISLIFKDILLEIDNKAQEELKQDLQTMKAEELKEQEKSETEEESETKEDNKEE